MEFQPKSTVTTFQIQPKSMKKVYKNSKSRQFAVNLSECVEDFGIPTKNQHCKSFQIPTKSDRKCGRFGKSNHNQQFKSFQIQTIFRKCTRIGNNIQSSRNTIFRKFAWKNLIFEPNLTAIHLKSFTFQKTQYFHKLLSEMLISAVNFNFIVIFDNIFWRGIFIMALLKTSNTRIFDLRG